MDGLKGEAPLRLLHLEDEPNDQELVRATLEAEGLACQVRAVSTRGEFAAVLESGDIDIILSDYALPSFDGLSALGMVQAIAPDVPFIFVSGTLGEEAAIEAVRSGATDYVLKHRLTRLVPAVRRAVNEAQAVRQRKEAEEALRKTEEQLRQAQKMEAVGRLAGGVAHDFNNLLTAIMGYGQLLQRRLPSGDPAFRDAEEIRRAAERAASLTRQLLAFSRQQILQPRVLDLNAAITDMHNMLRRLIGEDIELRTVPEQGLGHVKADPGQVEQVLMNLVINASDAMPAGGKLTIEAANVELDQAHARARQDVRPGPYVMLAVSDTDCGMDAATRGRIFEPFFTTKESGKGTGLGLSTVYGIIKQSDGHIDVYSEPGRGTTFKIYLPRVDESLSKAEPARAQLVLPEGAESVLVVEDDEAVRSAIRRTLQLCGYMVLEARDGAEALHLVGRQGLVLDLLVTDVVMPRMSGPELVIHVAAIRPELRVLYLSGYPDRAIIHHDVLASAPFLQKPFTPDALARKVREVLDYPQARAA